MGSTFEGGQGSFWRKDGCDHPQRKEPGRIKSECGHFPLICFPCFASVAWDGDLVALASCLTLCYDLAYFGRGVLVSRGGQPAVRMGTSGWRWAKISTLRMSSSCR